MVHPIASHAQTIISPCFIKSSTEQECLYIHDLCSTLSPVTRMYGSNWYLCFEVPGEVGDSGGMVQNLLVEPTNQRQESSLQQLTTSDSKTILKGSGTSHCMSYSCSNTLATTVEIRDQLHTVRPLHIWSQSDNASWWSRVILPCKTWF